MAPLPCRRHVHPRGGSGRITLAAAQRFPAERQWQPRHDLAASSQLCTSLLRSNSPHRQRQKAAQKPLMRMMRHYNCILFYQGKKKML